MRAVQGGGGVTAPGVFKKRGDVVLRNEASGHGGMADGWAR